MTCLKRMGDLILLYFAIGLVTLLVYAAPEFRGFDNFLCLFAWPVLIYMEVECIMRCVMRASEDYIFSIVDDIFRKLKR